MIIDKNINTELVYNELIAIKIGYKYSQLYENKFQKIKALLEKQDIYITSAQKHISNLESSQDISKEILNKSEKLFNCFLKKSKISINLTQRLLSKIKKDLSHIILNKENKIEIEKIFSILTNYLEIIKKNKETIADLVDRYGKIIKKHYNSHNSCKYANNHFLCYLYRLSHYKYKQNTANSCAKYKNSSNISNLQDGKEQ